MTIDDIKKLAELVTPELIRFLELSQNADTVLLPVKGDKLIFSGEAAKILRVNSTMISRYVREGLLQPVYTPHGKDRKFWLSEVLALPKKSQQEEET